MLIWGKLPGPPCFSILQVTKSWMGRGAWERDYFIQPSLELTFLPYTIHCSVLYFQLWTSSLTQDWNTFSKHCSSEPRSSRCGSSTYFEHSVGRTTDQNRQVLTFVTAGHGGSTAAWVFPKKLCRRVSKRMASTAKSDSSPPKIRFNHCGLWKFFNTNNCHAKDFQHENFPIYGTCQTHG